MKNTIGFTAAILLLGSTGLWSAAQQDKAGKKELKKLQGSWKAKQGGKSATMTFKGKNFTLKLGDENKSASVSGAFTIDTSKSPNTIDLKITKGEGKPVQQYIGKTSLGIYKLAGDSFSWCAAEPGDEERPAALADGGGNLYLQFERVTKKQE